uniref:Uncharacterized protein n=1 Tax=Rhizophora mucronata TaxID=61149 RepID=A0A2P2PIP3_RHIMU
MVACNTRVPEYLGKSELGKMYPRCNQWFLCLCMLRP